MGHCENKQTSIMNFKWRKLKPIKGDENHWQVSLFPFDVCFDIYGADGKYRVKMTWEDYTKEITHIDGFFPTLGAAKQGAASLMRTSFIYAMKWIMK